jgi:hypothetical protein
MCLQQINYFLYENDILYEQFEIGFPTGSHVSFTELMIVTFIIPQTSMQKHFLHVFIKWIQKNLKRNLRCGKKYF